MDQLVAELAHRLSGWADALNLIVAFALALFGFLLVRLHRIPPTGDETLRDYHYPQTALEVLELAVYLWSAYWFLPTLIFTLRTIGVDLTAGASVFLNDVQHTILIGLCVVLYRGTAVRLKHLLEICVPLIAVMGIWVLLAGNFASGTREGAAARWVLSIPSVFLSAIALLGVGAVVLFRFGWVAWPFFGSACAYALLQWPLYKGVVVRDQLDPKWLLFLLLGKIVYGGLFFVYITAPLAAGLAALNLVPTSRATSAAIWARSRRLLLAVLTFLAAALASAAGDFTVDIMRRPAGEATTREQPPGAATTPRTP